MGSFQLHRNRWEAGGVAGLGRRTCDASTVQPGPTTARMKHVLPAALLEQNQRVNLKKCRCSPLVFHSIEFA